MFAEARAIYLATRKRHDQLFNRYAMRPLAAALVAAASRTRVTPNQLTLASTAIFACGAALLVLLPFYRGSLWAVGVLELSYLLDCADGMLARYRKTASPAGHLFDFFSDEIKAVMLVAALGVRMWRTGGYGCDAQAWAPGSVGFLLGAIAAVAIVASATSLTNFVRRPEISGKDTPVEAHYEGEETSKKWTKIPITFLQFLNHYPSHIYLFAAFGRLDAFFWLYALNNGLYLGRGWLGLLGRFGRC